MILRTLQRTGEIQTSLLVLGLVSHVTLKTKELFQCNNCSRCLFFSHSQYSASFFESALFILMQKLTLHATKRDHISQHWETQQVAETVSDASLFFIAKVSVFKSKLGWSYVEHFIRTAYMGLFLMKSQIALSSELCKSHWSLTSLVMFGHGHWCV